MNTSPRTLVAMACLAVGTCVADPVADRGLAHATDARELVGETIELVNRLLVEEGPRLRAAWSASPGTEGEVPVYLVEGAPGAIVTPAAVPRGCRCVFVTPSVLRDWIRRNSTGPGRMDLDASNFLVFVLLHEIGHLRKQTAGAVYHDGAMSQLNVEPSRAKAAEEEADDFAADVLKRRGRQANADADSIAANWVLIELTKLSWNMQAFRTLDEFGAFSVGKPSVFFDDGYTHPNLAWRILRVNDRIHGTTDTRALLEAFEDARRRGANPQPLYRRDERGAHEVGR